MAENDVIDAAIVEDGSQPGSAAPARPTAALPMEITILPVGNRPAFPGMIVPMIYENEDVVRAVRMLAEARIPFVGLALTRNEHGPYTADNLYEVGVAGRIAKALEVGGKGLHLVIECWKRFRVQRFTQTTPPVRAIVEYYEEPSQPPGELERAYTVAIINTIKELLKHNPLHEEEMKAFAAQAGAAHPSRIADFAASLTSASREELQEILETFPLFDRLKKVLVLLNRELNVAKMQTKIREQIEQRISEQQRRFFLQEQLKEIQKELGMLEDPREKELKEIKSKAERLKMSEEARKALDEDLERLALLEPGSPEYAVARNHAEWLVSLPWGIYARERTSIRRARRILDRDHAGLEDVKARILEFIAVGARKKSVAGSIILFVGPPGVGKTSLGRSIATALGRPFYRFSVGGMRDEAEIKGHRRTYIGAMPGKIIQALKAAGAANPVIMIDEVDKIGADFRGDPASALLEVLDPEQNRDFLDHYLDVRFDLSRVLFLLTANQLDTIPPPLLDRAEVIHLPGYTPDEKLVIAKRHLWPKKLGEHGLSRDEVAITDAALKQMIHGYAREPGVRSLEQAIAKV
ncbi:MAG: endopeptidase La, partial [Zetaproteobacteria bacterium]